MRASPKTTSSHSTPRAPFTPTPDAVPASAVRRRQLVASAALHFAHETQNGLLRVAKDHHRVRQEEELVLDAREARVHAAFQHDDAARLFDGAAVPSAAPNAPSSFYHWPEFVERPWSIFLLYEGLSSFGGFTGALIGIVLWKHFEAVPIAKIPFCGFCPRPNRRSNRARSEVRAFALLRLTTLA